MTSLPIDEMKRAVLSALAEDLGERGDITTSAVLVEKVSARGLFLAESDGILAGLAVAQFAFKAVDESLTFLANFEDGEHIEAGDIIIEVHGEAASILKAERTALNFLQHLSGIATATSKFVEKAKPFKAEILDTRKTTPCLRALEKYAVRCGGGVNHRMGLYDAILIKDNHIKAAGDLTVAVRRAKEAHPDMAVEVETESLEMVKEALEAGADIIMLDNMTPSEVMEAVKVAHGRAILEASGGINLSNIEEYAKSGVDRISTSAITQAAVPLAISLDLILK
ncbi:MAG: carboxylating nicotinate-nucleotide diphosphorylase [Actinomycetota bacterium]|nr:carboxylating nicotinate-nucleotide diphosphorylase [Actinomycetota bacterium]